ncbi:diacylglycerol kinase (ATP) [Paenochrobactrum gallinarii]|uniref:Diacylglycerol kinase n=1 Tax=Paenochrobactrum gallinarii TaxID=643673 RepID=A0A841LSN0_9HYPH|nr:diacylglycerol kinase [Paenochrobactrum gallinarii]MBB6259497.1 diacylglycerol kinase (ATP) [Paenochrobactrum gallinarii]
MRRIFLAFINSLRALNHMARHEKAVQQELVLLLLALPVAFFLAPSFVSFLVLIGAVVLVLLVEILNTAIEATCDAVTTDFNKNIQIAKDAGSLAVLIAIIVAATTWGYILINTYWLS